MTLLQGLPSPALTAALLVGAGLAGCIDANAPDTAPVAATEILPTPGFGLVHGPDGVVVDPARAALLPQAAGVGLLIGAESYEPTIGVTPDGVLFMTAWHSGTLGFQPGLRRSADKGATWENAGPMLPTGDAMPPSTNDPYVYVDPETGRVFMSDLQFLLCSTLGWSDNLGDSWTTNPVACGTPVMNDHQTIVAAKPRRLQTVGYPNLVYYCVNRVADTACATSLTGGATFGPLVTAYAGAGSGFCGGLSGHVKAGPDGKVYLPKGHCGVPEVAVSEDDGLTWTRHVISEDVKMYQFGSDPVPDHDHEVAVAVDEAGNVYALWMGPEGLPYFAASTDGGATWTSARRVSPPDVTAAEFPAIAAGADGRVAFAYVGTTLPAGYENGIEIDCLLVFCTETPAPEWKNATWNAYVGVITDATSEDFLITTVTANDPKDPIARGVCGHTRCDGIGDFIDIVIDAEGRPWAAFVDVCDEDCAGNPDSKNNAAQGFAGTLVTGPALRGTAAALPTLVLAQPAED